MRTRLTRDQRRDAILTAATGLFLDRGYAGTEMEDIRQACAISRGGLYHHFANKRAVLDAIIEVEVTALADVLAAPKTTPIAALLTAGSSLLGKAPGVVAGLTTREDRLEYLSSLDQAVASILAPRLATAITGHTRPGTDPADLAELFLTVNAQINRRTLLGDWDAARAARFAATALDALAPLLRDAEDLAPIIADLKARSRS